MRETRQSSCAGSAWRAHCTANALIPYEVTNPIMFRIHTAGRTTPVILAIAAVLASASIVSGTALARHTHLVKSEPAANDTLSKAPAAIKLWFSEKVELAVTSVKVADATGHAVAVAPPGRPDTGSSAPVVVALRKPLAPGGYVVTWITAAKDGHPANGTIAFAVKPAR